MAGRKDKELLFFIYPFFFYNVCAPKLSTMHSECTESLRDLLMTEVFLCRYWPLYKGDQKRNKGDAKSTECSIS